MDEAASGGRTEFVGERYGKVYEGCVLCLQGVLKAGLLEREAEAEQVRERDGVRALEKAGWLDGVVKTYRDEDGHRLIQLAIGTCPYFLLQRIVMRLKTELTDVLRKSDLVAPRLIRLPTPIPTASEPMPSLAPTPSPFSHIRRDLVRLLGLLAHEDAAIQDEVRERGGLDVVLSMCAMDETHPCERLLLSYLSCPAQGRLTTLWAAARPRSARARAVCAALSARGQRTKPSRS